MPLPSLVSYKHNRNKFCRSWSLKGQVDGTNGETSYAALRCKAWACETCGPRKAATVRKAIMERATEKALHRFVTLTLNPRNCTRLDSAKYVRNCWAKMRTYLKRKYGKSISFISVIELQKSGYAHLHILVDRYIDQKWLSNSWDRIGGGKIVDIRWVDTHRVAHYLAKYLTKDMILDVPAGIRRYSTSRDILLIAKQKSGNKWVIIKIPIETLLSVHSRKIFEKKQSKSGELLFFKIKSG